MIEWMARVDPLREASTVKKMNDSKWCFEKNILSLQKLDASNRSS